MSLCTRLKRVVENPKTRRIHVGALQVYCSEQMKKLHGAVRENSGDYMRSKFMDSVLHY